MTTIDGPLAHLSLRIQSPSLTTCAKTEWSQLSPPKPTSVRHACLKRVFGRKTFEKVDYPTPSAEICAIVLRWLSLGD